MGEYIVEVPVTLRFTIQSDMARPRTIQALSEGRVRTIKKELAECDHIEDFDVDLESMEPTPQNAAVTYHGP